jgi:predicted outer membrane repeat protein
MKQLVTCLFLFLSLGSQAQTIYVRSNANGANNGTSWADAFTTLDAALAAAQPGQAIWVAAGLYKPSNPAPNHSFLLPQGVLLYGGFSGIENALSQRDPLLNLTTLSGDIAGNDIPGNFTDNRTDNSLHVVTVFANNASGRAVIDGFLIRNGHTAVGSPNADLNRRGGGMLVSAKLTVRNCRFSDNFGESGAAIAAIAAPSDGIVVDNCVFEKNLATEQAIVLLRQTPTGVVKNCSFLNNTANRGAFYPQLTVNLTIDSCLFEGNRNPEGFGSAMFSWQANWELKNSVFRKNRSANAGIYIDDREGGHTFLVDNCLFELDTATSFGGAGLYGWQATGTVKNTIFRNNHAPNAAATYFNGREFDSSFAIENCLFEGNTATNYGGTAIYHNRTNYTMRDCIFRNNFAPSSGAAIYHGDTTVFTVTNCLFEGHRGNYAAAIANYGIGCKGTFEGCTFQNNEANQGGGAVSNGFKADVLYKDCAFLNNKARFGGAIFTQNDTTRLRVDGCFFSENTTVLNGGSILVNRNIAASIKNSLFSFNTGDFGGALSASGGDSLLTIESCIFRDNFGVTQGAGVNLFDAKANITNCLFARNLNFGSGAGGGLSVNAGADVVSEVKVTNCTFAENAAIVGAGLAQYQDATGISTLFLQNCLFQNPDGDNYAVEDGLPELISLGGNQSSDGSFAGALNHPKDEQNLGVVFADPTNDDYSLTFGPAVDGGVADGAPLTDLNGKARIGLPDRGCYEWGTVSTKTVGFKPLPLLLSPNPAVEQTIVTLQNERIGDAELFVWNALGQQVAQVSLLKNTPELACALPVSHWPSGSYRVQIRIGSTVHEGILVKN